MNLSKLIKNTLLPLGGTALSLGILTACGPGAAQFGVLSTSQSTYQGTVANNKVDILFVIDNSGSMATKQTNLASGFGSFISIFNSKGFDYNMAVITTDTRATPTGQAGEIQGTVKVLTSSTPSLSTEFTNNVNVGILGDAQSKGIDAVALALNSANLAGANTGFIRSSAHLAVIFVSDADDNDSTTTTANLITSLTTLKPDRYDVVSNTYKKNFTVSAVVAPNFPDANCTANYGAGTYEKGTKFISLATSTNGSVASICDATFGAGLTTLSQRIAEAITEIPLSRVPDQSTIAVYFNSTAVANDATNGWTYDSAGQKIVFHGTAIPSQNTNITINYTPNDIIR